MHKSRLENIVIDCRTDDLWSEARFWTLPSAIPAGEVQVIIQRVHHEPRAHLDIETDSIDSEVARLEALGAAVVSRKKGG